MSSVTIEDVKIIQDFSAIPYFFHEKKKMLLKLLIKHEENIMSLKKYTKMNPGTIRRHLDDLIEKDLVKLVRTEINAYGQKEKYYRVTGRKFKVSIEFMWP